jgi:XTP/dITP diphosphohydrolase
MTEIVFATNNQHKLQEINALLDGKFNVIGLRDLDINEEIPEDHHTLEENASQKSWFIFNRTGLDCFADDTGLEVEYLKGAPGVLSARFARTGDPVFPHMEPSVGNIKKLLLKLEGVHDRSARFRTIISLIINCKEYQFEGIVEGEIAFTPSGSKGFGYDPVFIPRGYDHSFAEMDPGEKNRISHRAMAIHKLIQFLKQM